MDILNDLELQENLTRDINKLKVLVNSLKALEVTYQKLIVLFNNALKMADEKEIKSKLEEVYSDINANLDNKLNLEEQINILKNKINGQVIDRIKKAKEQIHNKYINTKVGVNVVFGIDGVSILEEDKEVYDSLYLLEEILNQVKNEDIIIYNNYLCINEEQKETVNKLLSKIRNKKETPNDKIIQDIVFRLRTLEENRKIKKKKSYEALNGLKILESDKEEYDSLLEILKLLHKADNSSLELVQVNDAYVLPEDVNKYQELALKTKILKQKVNEDTLINQKIIEDLENYIDKLANKITNNGGVNDLPLMAQTKKTTDKSWIVLKEDEQECNYIIAIIELLKKASINDKMLWNIGYIKEEDSLKFKQLVSRTSYFQENIPRIEANEKEILKIKESLAKLFMKAKDQKDVDSNTHVLMQDKEEYDLLNAKYNYIAGAIYSNELAEVDNVLIDKDCVLKYQEIIDKLKSKENNELNNNEEDLEEINAELNLEYILAIEEEINLLENDDDTQIYVNDLNAEEKEEIKKCLTKVKELLNKAKYTKDLEELANGVMIAKIDKEEYLSLINKLHSFRKEEQEEVEDQNKLKKTKYQVRKFKNEKAKEFVQQHRTLLIAIGVASAVSYASAGLLESIVYANSCNAAYNPTLAPFFNSINSFIASISDIKFANGAWLNGKGQIINSLINNSKNVINGVSLALRASIIGMGIYYPFKVRKDKKVISNLFTKLRGKFYNFKVELERKKEEKQVQQEVALQVQEIMDEPEVLDISSSNINSSSTNSLAELELEEHLRVLKEKIDLKLVKDPALISYYQKQINDLEKKLNDLKGNRGR